MKKLVFAGVLSLLITLLLSSAVFGAEIISAESDKHGVMYPEGYNVIDEIFKLKFITTGDTKEVLINSGNGDSVIATNPFGNKGKDEFVRLESGIIVSGTAGTRVFKFKAVGYDGSITPYDKEIVLECYNRDGKGLTILSVETENTVIKEVVAGHDAIESLQLTIATTIDVRDLMAVNEKGEVIKDISEICRSRGSCDIIDGVKYWKFYFISPIVGERSFTFQAVNDYGNPEGKKETVNYTVIADEEWDRFQQSGGGAGLGDQPGTDEGFSSGDDKNATGNEDGVENGGKGQSDTDTSEGSTEKGENTENSKPDGEATGKPSAEEKEEPKEEIKEEPKEEQKEEPKEETKEETKPSQSTGSGNGGNCCNHEDFISFIVPASSPTLVIEFPDGTKYNAVDQEKKNLASSEKSKDGNRIFWDVWIGSEYEYEDLKVTVYDENYNSRYDYTVYETNPFTESEITEYEKAISNELRIEENPNQLIVELAINNKWMIINNRDLVEIDPGRDTTPVLVDGRTMLPIRAIVEVLGGKVGWEESTRCVHIEIFNKDIKFYIDSLDMTWNNIPAKMDVAPQIINERTMLPIRFVAEVLDHTTVEWNGQSASVTITYNY